MPLRLLLIQLLPIAVFIVADLLLQDPLWAIAIALCCVVFQAGVIFVRQRRIDRFILVDLLLVGGLGAASLLSANDLFFKLKPAIMEAVIVPLFLFLALAKESIVTGYLGRYTGGMNLNQNAVPLLRWLLLLLALLVLLHAGVVVVAALFLSRQAWAWISGPGFYLLLLPILLWAAIRRIKLRRSQTRVGPPSTALPPSSSRSQKRVRPRAGARRKH